MSVCKGCGAPLEWIRTEAGRTMPVDPEPVFIIEGEVITGRRALPEEERRTLPVAFVPHWKTCTAADRFRRK